MKYNRLGQTGLFVSELCMGTWGFSGRNYFGGAIGTLSQKDATAFIGRALEAKINFIDTANVYSFGDSEAMTGQALKDLGVKRRSWCWPPKCSGAWEAAQRHGCIARPYHGQCALEPGAAADRPHRSLPNPSFDPITPLEETMRALDDLVRQSWCVRRLNWEAWKMKANGIAEKHGPDPHRHQPGLLFWPAATSSRRWCR
jgi:aryl-alcohol dehydrogenase-like predicted oxidoreductase